MKPQNVLLDQSFINALVYTENDMHDQAVEIYSLLVDAYANNSVKLFANSDFDVNNALFRPVESLRVTEQHRNAARAIDASVNPALALTLVLVQREAIDAVASFDPEIGMFQVSTIGPSQQPSGLELDD
jgi:hypothetical protein